MTELTALSQLRHLYQNMVNGAVRDTASAKRIAEGLLAPAIAALERTTPQPTQAQAGAVPLTDEQWQRIADLTGGRILTQAVKDEIERVIGIKGGQHG